MALVMVGSLLSSRRLSLWRSRSDDDELELGTCHRGMPAARYRADPVEPAVLPPATGLGEPRAGGGNRNDARRRMGVVSRGKGDRAVVTRRWFVRRRRR